MARFGSPPEEHRRRMKIDVKQARNALSRVTHALKQGNCARAIDWLEVSARWYGEARAHSISVGGPRAVHRQSGSHIPGGMRRLLGLKRRVIRACTVR